MTRPLPPLPAAELDPAQRALYETFSARSGELTRKRLLAAPGGALAGPWNVWLRNPDLGLVITSYLSALRTGCPFPDRLREILILYVVEPDGYEWVEHALKAKQAGVRREEIDAIRLREPIASSDLEETTAISATLELVEHGDLSDALFADCERELGISSLIYLVTLIGNYKAIRLLIEVFRIPALTE